MYVVRGVWGWPYYKAVTCMLVTRPRACRADILIISCVVSMDTEQFVKALTHTLCDYTDALCLQGKALKT